MADTHTNPASTTGQAPTAVADPPVTGGTSGIDHLTKMSTTAGLGVGDYAAINTLAVVAVVTALVGALAALLADLLLVVPAAALVCAVVALRQIAASNGTQAGRPLAWAAVLVSLGVGGYVIGSRVLHDMRTKPDREAILNVVREFDKALAANDPRAAYQQLTTPTFRRRVPERDWLGTFAQFEAIPEFGGVSGIEWNGVPMIFEEDKETGVRQVYAGLVFKYRKSGLPPTRMPTAFTKVDGKWQINEMSTLFRSSAPSQQQQGQPGRK